MSTKKKSITLFVYNDPNSFVKHLYQIHPIENIADDTAPYKYIENIKLRDERTAIRVCRKFMHAAGCPIVKSGKMAKVKVTIERTK